MVKAIRSKGGQTLVEYGEATGLDPGYLSRLENGKITLGPAVLGRLLVVLSDTEAARLLNAFIETQLKTIVAERDVAIQQSKIRSDSRRIHSRSRFVYE